MKVKPPRTKYLRVIVNKTDLSCNKNKTIFSLFECIRSTLLWLFVSGAIVADNKGSRSLNSSIYNKIVF